MTEALSVRPETAGDHAAVRRVVGAAFGDEQVPALLDALRRSESWVDLSLVCEVDGELVGHVSMTRAWVDDPHRLVGVLVLSPLSVRPDRQRSGLGSALVEAALRVAAERGEPLVFLEGSPRYYPRFGFVPARTLGFTAPSRRIPPDAFQVFVLATYRSSISGALVYPDAFWRHDAVGLRGG